LSNPPRKELGWPAAATLIAAMIGAAATSIALAIAPPTTEGVSANNRTATAREIGEVKARLKSLEEISRRMQAEIREDIKDLRVLIQSSMQRRQHDQASVGKTE